MWHIVAFFLISFMTSYHIRGGGGLINRIRITPNAVHKLFKIIIVCQGKLQAKAPRGIIIFHIHCTCRWTGTLTTRWGDIPRRLIDWRWPRGKTWCQMIINSHQSGRLCKYGREVTDPRKPVRGRII